MKFDNFGSDLVSELLHFYKGYAFHLAAVRFLYAPSNRQDSTYHSIYYTSHGANSSMGPPWGIDLTTHHTLSGHSTTELHLAPVYKLVLNVNKKEIHKLTPRNAVWCLKWYTKSFPEFCSEPHCSKSNYLLKYYSTLFVKCRLISLWSVVSFWSY